MKVKGEHAKGTKVLIEYGINTTTEKEAIVSGYKINKNGALEAEFKSLAGYNLFTINAKILKTL